MRGKIIKVSVNYDIHEFILHSAFGCVMNKLRLKQLDRCDDDVSCGGAADKWRRLAGMSWLKMRHDEVSLEDINIRISTCSLHGFMYVCLCKAPFSLSLVI